MRKSTLVHLVRHGEAAAQWGDDPDPGLSEAGQHQARRAAQALCSLDPAPERIVTSPLRRARETAAPFADHLVQTPVVDACFRELPAPVALTQRGQWIRSFMTQRWVDQGDEITRWRTELLQRIARMQGHVAVFTHFVVINAVVAHVTADPQTLCVKPANGSVFSFGVADGEITLMQKGAELESVVN